MSATNKPSSGNLTPGAPRLRVVADRSACCGYGLCAEICPEVYHLDDNGIVTIATPLVPMGLEGKARDAASACPQSALEVQEV